MPPDKDKKDKVRPPAGNPSELAVLAIVVVVLSSVRLETAASAPFNVNGTVIEVTGGSHRVELEEIDKDAI